MNKVLIVIDAQEDFTRGALRNEEAIKALPILHDVVNFAAKNFDLPILYTRDTHDDNTYLTTQEGRNLPVPHCLKGHLGWYICEEALPDVLTEYTLCKVNKPTFGYLDWKGWGLTKDIGKADEIWLCGFCTDICVSANFQILKAVYPEIPIVVIEDACAGVTPELHDAALKVMKSCQAKVMTWKELKEINNET